MNSRLQFRFHNDVFVSRDSAIEYIKSQIRYATEGLAASNKRLGFSLYGEPTVLRYKNEEDETDPHLMFVIGSVTNEGDQYEDNRFCIIDIDKTEKEIQDIEEALEEAIKGLSIITNDSNTLKLYSEKTEDGTILSGDVKVSESRVFSDDVRRYDNLMVTEDGLFIYVDLTYDEESETFKFTVSNNDGSLTETSVKLPNNYLVGGYYDIRDESIHLTMREGGEVIVDCKHLIDEWGVEGSGSTTPLVLTKEKVSYEQTDEHWRDILRADVRLQDESFDEQGRPVYEQDTTNILRRTNDGRYLYVRGEADNIKYGENSNVKSALDKLMEIKLSTDSQNILIEDDGFFANVELEYVSNENKLVFKKSSQSGEKVKEIPLNSIEILENIYYESSTETLIITYKDSKGETKYVSIPIGQLLTDWEWEVKNEGHNVELTKTRNIGGNDTLSADLKILEGHNNILVDSNHNLYVRGEADNIKYGENSNVDEALDGLIASAATLDNKIETEKSQRALDDSKLKTDIDTVSADTATRLRNIINYDSSINVDRSVETEPFIKVNLSQEIEDNKPNIIKLNSDGLYAGVDLEYQFDEQIGTNRLIFKTTDSIKTIDLKTNSVVDKIYYDPIREAIIVEYTINGVRQPDVVIPLGELINEWRIWEGHEGAIQLEKIRNTSGTPDVLKASVVISNTHDDNIIINDNGALYVSGKDIADNKSEINALKTRMTTAEDNITNEYERANAVEEGIINNLNREIENREADVNAEKTRAIAIENGLREDLTETQTNLSNEISRSTSTDAALQTAISTEAANREHGDNDLSSAIISETVRATSAETALQTAINNEVTNREHGDSNLSSAIASEATRATSAESALQTAIDNEASRATTKENELAVSVNTNASNIATEISRATSAENQIASDLVAEEGRAITAESSLSHDIETEHNRASSVEAALQTAISTEAANREHGDSDLSSAIASEATRATSAETALQTAINNEVSRATSAEETNRGKIESETIRAINAETTINNLINSEVNRAISAETSITASVVNEKARAIEAETSLETLISSETITARAEEARIETKLNGEISRATSAEATLQSAIDAQTLRFNDSQSIDFNRDGVNVTGSVKLSENGENIISIDGNGLLSTVDLGYDSATNTLTLIRNGKTNKTLQLSAGSLLNNISYDQDSKSLVITYTTAQGSIQTLSFPVDQLFNEWDVDNSKANSAVKLYKTPNTTETGTVDLIRGRVKILGEHEDEEGNITYDYGDNALRMVGDYLYVSSSAMSEAVDISECTNSELKSVERAIFGKIAENCGADFVYEPPVGAVYVNTANTINDAVYILDNKIHETSAFAESIDAKIDDISHESVEGVKRELKVVEDDFLGMPLLHEYGEGDSYRPNEGCNYISASSSFNESDIILDSEIKNANDNINIVSGTANSLSNAISNLGNKVTTMGNSIGLDSNGSYITPSGCFISAATSFASADEILDTELCNLKSAFDTLATSGDTSSIHLYTQNSSLKGKVRLSHGNNMGMSDAELLITNSNGETIENGVTYFTNTNVLRIVENSDSLADAKINGVYLSNNWNCGKYYQLSTEANEILVMQANGYTINSYTDETEGTSNINYMNNVR